jgi:integrase
MSTGIETRHGRSCAARNGGRCSCAPTYQAHVWDAKAAKRIRKTFATRSAAKQWREDARVALRAGDLSADRGPLLKDAIDAWFQGLRAGHITNRSGDRYKPGAIRGYEQNLRLRVTPVLGDRRMADVTTQDVQKLVDGLIAAGLEPATIDSALTPLKALYRRALARGEVRLNPTVGIEKPAVRSKAKRVVLPNDAEAMIAALDTNERALWATAIYAGLRRGELIGLRRQDIDLATGLLHVRRGWDMIDGEIAPKSRQGRRDVPVAGVLRDHLDELLLDLADDNHVFGRPEWVCRAGRRARERWEARRLPVLTMHECRHVYASHAIAAGVNAKTLSTYMGHANIAITFDLYGHLMPGDEAHAVGLLDAYYARHAIGTSGPTVAPIVAHPAQTAA